MFLVVLVVFGSWWFNHLPGKPIYLPQDTYNSETETPWKAETDHWPPDTGHQEGVGVSKPDWARKISGAVVAGKDNVLESTGTP